MAGAIPPIYAVERFRCSQDGNREAGSDAMINNIGRRCFLYKGLYSPKLYFLYVHNGDSLLLFYEG